MFRSISPGCSCPWFSYTSFSQWVTKCSLAMWQLWLLIQTYWHWEERGGLTFTRECNAFLSVYCSFWKYHKSILQLLRNTKFSKYHCLTIKLRTKQNYISRLSQASHRIWLLLKSVHASALIHAHCTPYALSVRWTHVLMISITTCTNKYNALILYNYLINNNLVRFLE